ncbi:GGDEF domain-containing protein [Neptunomonas japonica]|uniref:diguanylate cyclase n=1 Tax=Neptunomonas japonica JAMM 1380 TaxID=1441457 RepID=A0A7R6SWY6_9GAMM|nr:diguanylate cyclase [Neptunomonas japonica]BBB31199.1 signal transduction protein [Neptunomonas japonica JAMM 1380]
MTTEQAYFFTVALINLVLAFSGTRVADPDGKQKSILFFIIAFSANCLSWFLYTFDINVFLKIISAVLSSAFIWGMVVFSFKRCECRLPLATISSLFLINCIALAFFIYNSNFNDALHVSALFVPSAFCCIGYLFIKVKKNRNPSDIILSYACFFMALCVVTRSFLLELSPELFSKTMISSQIIWPAFSVISGVFSLLSFTEEAQLKLKEESNTDQLTNLANRRAMNEVLNKEWTIARRHKRPLTLIMLDVDFFKKYNDLYGHQAGDECLKSVARTLQGNVKRAGDLVARYGGEEFLLILPDTNNIAAQHLANRICTSIAQLELPHDQSPLGIITISAGIAVLTKNSYENIDELLRGADTALYQAKQMGRNQTQLI